MMFGNAAIFISRQPSVVLTGTPVLLNFHIENDQQSRVYFDASADVTGMNTTGFVISGKTISSITIDGDGLGGYFTVSTPFTFWDNNTIRCGEHTDTADVNETIHNFTLQYITNNIAEPTGLTPKYVTVAGGGDGSAIGTPMTLSQAFTEKLANTIYHVKAGNYGSVTTVIVPQGTPTTPTIYQGYVTDPGDLNGVNYYTYSKGVALSSSAAPLLTVATNTSAIVVVGSNLIIRNIQVQGASSAFYSNNSNRIIFDNCVSNGAASNGLMHAKETGETSVNCRIINSNAINANDFHNFYIGSDFSYMNNNKSYADSNVAGDGTDYYYAMSNTSNSITRNCFAKKVDAMSVSAHGISIQTITNSNGICEYCLVENNEIYNIAKSVEFRHQGVRYSVARGNNMLNDNINLTTGGVNIKDNPSYNIVEQNFIDIVTGSAFIFQETGENIGTGVGFNNIVKNNIVKSAVTAIEIWNYTGIATTGSNNKIINNTFYDCDELFKNGTDITLTGCEFKNNIVQNVTTFNNGTGFTWTIDRNNFNGGFAAQGTNATIVNPNFINLIGFEPQTEMYVPRIDGIWYDYSVTGQRAVSTTIGAVKHANEVVEEVTPPIYTPKYYVSNIGSDSNNGLTQATAWQTIGKLNSTTFAAGDVIAFKKGDTFTDNWLYLNNQDGTAQAHIVFTSYGNGDKPIIDVTRTYSGAWTNTGTNIWRSDVWTTFASDVTRLMVDGEQILTTWIQAELGTNISLSGTDPNGFVGAWLDQTGEYIYLYSTTDPSTKVVKHNGLSRALLLRELNYVTFHDLEIKGGYYTGITVDGCKNVTFDNIKAGAMSAVGATVSKYNLVTSDNIKITNSLFDTGFAFDYRNCTRNTSQAEHRGASDGIRWYDGAGGEVSNNTIRNWDHSSISLTATETTGEISGIKVFNNYCTIINGMPYGGGMATDRVSHNNEIYNNTFYKTKSIQLNGYSNHFHHNILQTKHPVNYDYAEGFGIDFNPYAGPCHDNIVENNVFYECGSGAIRFKQNSGIAQNYNHIVRNNIMYNCGADNTYKVIEYNYGTSIHDNTVDNNIIYNTATANVIYDAGTTTYRTVTQFNSWTLYGTSVNNIASNPLFVIDGSDYHLQNGSPAIDAGVTPTATEDRDGNTIPYSATNPDIGAYEYGY